MEGRWRRERSGGFTVCKRVESLGGDDHLSPPALVLILPVRDLSGAMLGERVVLGGGQKERVNNTSTTRQQHAWDTQEHTTVSSSTQRRTCSSDWGMALSMATGAW